MRDLRRVIARALSEGNKFILYKKDDNPLKDGFWISSKYPHMTGFILDFVLEGGEVVPKNDEAANCLQFKNL